MMNVRPYKSLLRLILVLSIASCATSGKDSVGMASWYGKQFQGRQTANGERFDMHQLTAAHRTLPFGTLVRVTSRSTGQSVVVRINDRGPFARDRIIDLSYEAARRIGIIERGHDEVELERL